MAVLLAWAAWLGLRSWAAPRPEFPMPWVEVRPTLSRDGGRLAFAASRAARAQGHAFGPRTEGDLTDVLLWDGQRIVEVTAGADGASTDPCLSPEGDALAFCSEATNLVPGDVDRITSVFLRAADGGLRRVPPPAPRLADGASFAPALAAGRLAFVSTGVPEEIRSVVLLEPLRVLPGRPLGPVYGRPSLAPDGSAVAYASFRDWPAETGRRGLTEILLSPAEAEEPPATLSLGLRGQPADGPSYSPWLARGRCAFTSLASNLVEGDGNGQFDIFVRDLGTGRTLRASQGLDEGCFEPSLSEDGRWLAFSAYVGGAPQVFLRDLEGQGPAERVAAGYDPCLSGDGRALAFASREGGGDVWLWSRDTRSARRVPVR